jgi:mannose-6-phosphate isomerase
MRRILAGLCDTRATPRHNPVAYNAPVTVWRRPFQLLPTFAERPWGVHDLGPLLVNPTPTARIGEAWFTAPDNPTSVGTPFGALTDAEAVALLGDGVGPECPLLVKLLFTSERLSVQVHPDDDYAGRTHGAGARGKTEAWHVVAATPEATIGLGTTAALTREQAAEAARTGTLADLVDWRPVRAGDTYLVPAGTVHALGPGLTIVEVQQQSDLTYRLYDYGRGRDLHLEDGLAVARLEPYTLGAAAHEVVAPGRDVLTRCRYFTMERWRVGRPLSFRPSAFPFHVVVVLDGSGYLAGQAFTAGEVWFVPARADAFTVEGRDATLLVTYPSDTLSPSFRHQA